MNKTATRPPTVGVAGRGERMRLEAVSHLSCGAVNDGALVRLADGRAVGRLAREPDDQLVFVRRVDRARHQLHRPAAWSFNIEVVEALARAGAAEIRLVEGDGTRWTAPVAVLLQHGVHVNRGWGAQLALPLCYWRRADPVQPALPGFGGATDDQ